MTKLYNGDCLDILKTIPDNSIDLILTDPPYNIGKANWDKIPHYIEWCTLWLKECDRVLKATGVMYWWHNDMQAVSALMQAIKQNTSFQFRSFCVWDKGEFRALAWKSKKPESKSRPRLWFCTAEYCLHYVKGQNKGARLARLYDHAGAFSGIKKWYLSEVARLDISEKSIAIKYTEFTGKKPHMLRHYFKDTQFAIPSEHVWNGVYIPLGFSKSYAQLQKDFETYREDHRKEFDAAGEKEWYTHNVDPDGKNIWKCGIVPNGKRLHICEKPVELLERIVNVSSNPGDTVLDIFMGSGSTGEACDKTGRNFVGIEKDEQIFLIAQKRLEK